MTGTTTGVADSNSTNNNESALTDVADSNSTNNNGSALGVALFPPSTEEQQEPNNKEMIFTLEEYPKLIEYMIAMAEVEGLCMYISFLCPFQLAEIETVMRDFDQDQFNNLIKTAFDTVLGVGNANLLDTSIYALDGRPQSLRQVMTISAAWLPLLVMGQGASQAQL